MIAARLSRSEALAVLLHATAFCAPAALRTLRRRARLPARSMLGRFVVLEVVSAEVAVAFRAAQTPGGQAVAVQFEAAALLAFAADGRHADNGRHTLVMSTVRPVHLTNCIDTSVYVWVCMCLCVCVCVWWGGVPYDVQKQVLYDI